MKILPSGEKYADFNISREIPGKSESYDFSYWRKANVHQGVKTVGAINQS
jgi:hypothetical protein